MKLKGIVIKGKEKSKKLGFPTANIKLDEKLESGVFAGEVVLERKRYKAAIFLGSEGEILEAHILDFDGDLYGKKIEVELGEKIRDVIKFDDNNALREQIKKDVEICLREL